MPLRKSSSQLPASSSLAAHYIPDKLAASASDWDGADVRRQGRLAVGGFGAAAGRKSTLRMTASESGTLHQSPSKVGLDGVADNGRHATSALGPAVGGSGSPPSNLRSRKIGAGRSAWGENGGGYSTLGAGGYESDDGIELSHTHGTHLQDDRRPALPHAGFSEAQQTRRASPGDETSTTPSAQATRSSSSRQESRNHASQGVVTRALGIHLHNKTGRFNQFKWALIAANTVLTAYSLAGFVAVMLTWANYFPNANVVLIVNKTELILATVAMCLCMVTAVIGWTGILLNNRAFLAVYALFLWISLAFIVSPGYIAYKKRTFNLSGKMNRLWSQQLSLGDRRMIQTVLTCCGYYSPYIEAAADGNRCYARSLLDGCKGPLIDFQRSALRNFYTAAFGVVPAHLACIVITILCANHITYRFGKGVTPARYRVDDQTLQQAFNKTAFDLTIQGQTQHVLYADQPAKRDSLLSPRPPFWKQISGISTNSATS
jgi:hypothetical protein